MSKKQPMLLVTPPLFPAETPVEREEFGESPATTATATAGSGAQMRVWSASSSLAPCAGERRN